MAHPLRRVLTQDEADTLVRQGELGRYAQESATLDFHSERAAHVDKAAHGFVYHGLRLQNPGIVYDAYLKHVSELQSAT